MRHLPVLFLLCIPLIAQAQSAFRAADSLSAAGRYIASNELLENLIQSNPGRLHDQSRALFLMSYNYLQLGSFQQAEDANTRSMALRDQLMSGDIAENYMRIGAIALQQGNYEKALDHLFIATSMPIEDPKLYALIYGYIASAFEGLSQPEKALNYYRQSLETLQSATEGSEADIATNYYHIGRVYLGQNKLEEAKSAFRQALNISRQVPARKDLQGNLYNALGETMRQDTPSVAVEYYHQALAIYRKAFGEHHRETARTSLNLGQLHYNLNEPDSASFYANKALFGLCPGMAKEAELLQNKIATLDRPLLALTLNLKAVLLLDYGSDDRLALAYGKQAAAFIEEEVIAIGDDASRLRLLAASADVFESGIIAAYRLFLKEHNPHLLEQAFEMAEYGKAILLRMNAANLDSGQLLPADKAIRAAELRSKWRYDEASIALNPEDAALRRAAMESRKQYEAFISQIAGEFPAFVKARGGIQTASVIQVRQQLEDHDVLLSYFIGKLDYYIFALTKTGIYCRQITKGRDFRPEDTKAQKFVKKMMNFQANPMGTGPGVYTKFDQNKIATDLNGAIKGFLQSIKKSDSKAFPLYGQLLFDRLIQPVDSMLKGKDRLIIIPHQNLFSIPFEAFISGFSPDDDGANPGYNKLNYLIKSYVIQYSYAAALTRQTAALSTAPTFLGMAPVFDNETSLSYIWDSNLFAFDTTYQGSYSLRSATRDGLSFQALPESERETVSISKMFAKDKKTALAYLRMEAGEANFKAGIKGYGIVHLATHSFVNYANPALSGIAFSQPNIGKPDKEDGILYAGEIAALDMNGVNLVVLSSCESGSGPTTGNEGALSLTRSFLTAGTPSVLSSLWKVYDSYTSQLMQLFYGQVLDEKRYAEALRYAKLKMIKDSKSADPRKWSGFVLFGAL